FRSQSCVLTTLTNAITGFKAIVPCGISDFPVGSLAELVPDISIEQVRDVLAACFAEVFGVTLKLTREEKAPGTIAIT
ncbi:MAG: hypothetical protein P5702_26320, partial [Limnospira sp. PMC 1291.21]|nr:hypothetical protein [Limnospira sp. PMC 1238.20]MDT9252549.1 hypothetical protein [Limnospira sp. PMC 1280.21]MDT9303556.1 hypothetical protein [Limnospira sp. PMC 1281.21]MDT9308706.1 hypothetical protein [Limnospira sp. PMC 1291.21]